MGCDRKCQTRASRFERKVSSTFGGVGVRQQVWTPDRTRRADLVVPIGAFGLRTAVIDATLQRVIGDAKVEQIDDTRKKMGAD